MPALLQVQAEDILRLRDLQLAKLLQRLLSLEASAFGISQSAISFSSNVTAKDEGSDATVRWNGTPKATNWITKPFTVFQAKATGMEIAKCVAEMFERSKSRPKRPIRKKDKTWIGRTVKKAIAEVLGASGGYVIISTQRINDAEAAARVKSMRAALKEAGVPFARKGVIRILGADQIATWVNQHLSAIAQILEWLGGDQTGLQTWDSVARYEDFVQCEYVKGDPTRDSQLQQLRDYMGQPRRVARVSGLPGIGKTRFVLEAFRPLKSAEEKSGTSSSFPDRFVYVDTNVALPDLVQRVVSWRQNGISGFLVVDNCTAAVHERLAKEIRHADSKLGVVTIGIDDEEIDAANDSVWIRLEEVDSKVIEGMLKRAYPSLSGDDMRFIAQDLAQGFPQMAALLANARLSAKDLGSVVGRELLKRLVGEGAAPHSEAYEVIAVCALFESLGFFDDAADQRIVAAKALCTKVNSDQFYTLATGFIRRGILTRYGRFVSVRPKPLAIRLAADWWAGIAPERARVVLTESLPEDMVKALCERVRMLDFVPALRTVTADLCGDQGPFGQAEVLNSEVGSQLFRALVEVNPQATARAVETAFASWTKEQLKAVGPGRRNLVWALEKLAFWEETFGPAARTLRRFAGAEVESWSNNSTGVFLGLFPVFLSGTQAPPAARLKVVDECLASSDEREQELGVKALGRALETIHYSRMVGAEQQGSRPPQPEWKPKIWNDVFGYWREVLGRLTQIASNADNPFAPLAAAQISHQIRGLVSYGLMDELEESLKKVLSGIPAWTEGLGQVKDAIRYEGKKIPKEGLRRLEGWLVLFRPTDVSDRLRLVVTQPPFEHVEESSGEWVDVAAQNATSLATEYVDRVEELFPYFKQLLNGSQRQAYVFGRELGSRLLDVEQCIRVALSELKSVPNPNVALLGGILAGAQRQNQSRLIAKTLDEVAEQPILRALLVDLTRSIEISNPDLIRIAKSVEAREIVPGAVIGLSYGRSLEKLSARQVMKFCDRVGALGSEGAWAALDVLFMYCHGSDARWKACRSAFRRILLTRDMLTIVRRDGSLSTHGYATAATRLLSKRDNELAVHLAKEVVRVAKARKPRYDIDHDLVEIVAVLFDRYAELCWPIFGRALLGSSSASFFLRHLLGRRFGQTGEGGLISRIPVDLILNWCKANSEKGPAAIAEMISVMQSSGSQEGRPTDVARALLCTFGDRPKVLAGLSVNIHSFSWSGSTIPIHQRQLKFFESLLEDEKREVREWAQRQASAVREDIERETVRVAETSIGRY